MLPVIFMHRFRHTIRREVRSEARRDPRQEVEIARVTCRISANPERLSRKRISWTKQLILVDQLNPSRHVVLLPEPRNRLEPVPVQIRAIDRLVYPAPDQTGRPVSV